MSPSNNNKNDIPDDIQTLLTHFSSGHSVESEFEHQIGEEVYIKLHFRANNPAVLGRILTRVAYCDDWKIGQLDLEEQTATVSGPRLEQLHETIEAFAQSP